MFAKLTIYPTNPASASESIAASEPVTLPGQPEKVPQSDKSHNWQLVADNLTTGKVMELLVCLDQLGFFTDATDPCPVNLA